MRTAWEAGARGKNAQLLFLRLPPDTGGPGLPSMACCVSRSLTPSSAFSLMCGSLTCYLLITGALRLLCLLLRLCSSLRIFPTQSSSVSKLYCCFFREVFPSVDQVLLVGLGRVFPRFIGLLAKGLKIRADIYLQKKPGNLIWSSVRVQTMKEGYTSRVSASS